MEEFEDKQFIVTGGGGAIGRACAVELLERGARVLLVDVNGARLDAVMDELGDTSRVSAHASALASPAEAAAAFEAAGGKVHGLINMAGLFEHDLLDPDDRTTWDRSMAANLTNAYDLSVAYQKYRDPNEVGRIVLCASLAFRRGAVGHVAYSSAKAGIVGMTRALSREFAPHTRVNAVAPGLIHTTMTDEVVATRGDAYLATVPLGRLGKPQDVSGVVTFLCSNAAGYVTGQVINIDGGVWNT